MILGAPQLEPYKTQIRTALAYALQNKRKYEKDVGCGKRV